MMSVQLDSGEPKARQCSEYVVLCGFAIPMYRLEATERKRESQKYHRLNFLLKYQVLVRCVSSYHIGVECVLDSLTGPFLCAAQLVVRLV